MCPAIHPAGLRHRHRLPFALLRSQQGSILIGVIATMVVVAVMGTAMVTLTTTSSYTQVGAFDSIKAFYLAEAGAHYAVPIIRKEAAAAGDPFAPSTGSIDLLNNKTFTMANGDKFHLSLDYTAPTYTLESVGILRQGASAFEATRKVTFVIDSAVAPETPLTFETTADLQENMTLVTGDASVVADKLKIDNNLTEIGLNWVDSTTLPDLLTTWTNNDGLLGYALQVKANMNTGSEFVAGLSFRVSADTDSSYGFSFVKRAVRDRDCGESIPQAFCDPLTGGVLYLVIWKKVSGSYTIIDYHQAQVGDGVVDSRGRLKEWSTLLVRVEERYQTDGNGNYLDGNGQVTTDPAARVRENIITAYVQGQDDTDAKAYQYQRQTSNCSCAVADCSCTIHWDYATFNQVDWHGAGSEPIIDRLPHFRGFCEYHARGDRAPLCGQQRGALL